MLIHPLDSLEAATSRLEDIAVHQQSNRSAEEPATAANGTNAALPAAGAASTATIEVSPAVDAWDEVIVPMVKTFAELSQTIGGTVADQVCGKIFSYSTTYLLIMPILSCSPDMCPQLLVLFET